MNTRWLLYASTIAGVSIILLYIAYNVVDRDVVNVRVGVNFQLPLGTVRLTSNSYQGAVNSLSQETSENSSYKQSIGWMFSDRTEENITIQGYAVGWDFYEAQTCAARNLVGLQRWATSLDFGVVEPFVAQSYFRTSHFNNEKALRLSDYFDIDVWNQKIVNTIPYATPLVKWEDFISKAARQLIVVHTMIGSKEPTKVYVNDEVKRGDCWQPRNFGSLTLSKYGFTVVRTICFKFNIRSPVPIDEFNKYILGPFKANSVSIIFTFVPGVNRARINILETQYHHKFVDWLKPSKRVINDAKKYIDMFLDKSYVAVSLRTVKMAISLRSKHPADIRQVARIVVNKCVDEIGQILSSISSQHFMTIDIGRFGDPKASSFMTSAIATEIINKMIKVTYNNLWNQTTWENTFIKAANGISDSGYIASLQKEIASHASSLIAAGGGSFQSSMKLQHQSQSPQSHHVLQPCSISDLYPKNQTITS